MTRSLFIIVLIIAAAFGIGLRYVGQDEPYQVTRYTDTEAGFEEVGDALVPEVLLSETGIPEFMPSVPEFSGEIGQFIDGRVRWSYYWREFTPEEQQLYGSWQRPPVLCVSGFRLGMRG